MDWDVSKCFDVVKNARFLMQPEGLDYLHDIDHEFRKQQSCRFEILKSHSCKFWNGSSNNWSIGKIDA